MDTQLFYTAFARINESKRRHTWRPNFILETVVYLKKSLKKEKSLLCHFSISFIWRSWKALRMNVLALKNLFFKQIHRNGVEYSIFGCTSNSDLDIAVSKENYITRPKFDLTVRSSLSTLFLSLRKMRRRVTWDQFCGTITVRNYFPILSMQTQFLQSCI